MDGLRIIDVMVDKIKSDLFHVVEQLECELTPHNVTKIGKMLVDAAAQGVASGVKEYAEQQDFEDQVVQHNGQMYHRKAEKVDKKFLTIGGEITMTRTVYQASGRGPCHVPLDHAMGVAAEYALPDVRETILYMCTLLTTREVEDVVRRFAMFRPSDKAIRNTLVKMGVWMEQNEDDALTRVSESESLSLETDVMVVGMDGANVLLRERGKKKGRPLERPVLNDSSDETKSCYKNAMTGTISLYTTKTSIKEGRAVLEHERLHGTYTSRMPEERFPTFKAKLEREVRHVQSRVPPGIARIVLMDGARGLWKYVENTPLFEGYELLLDFYHMTEHLSNLAEALFGKGSDGAKSWYKRYREKIKHDSCGVASMQRSVLYNIKKLNNRKLSKKRRDAIRREETFFSNNKSKMEYARFLENGWPIGSGPTESGCKVLVKQRLCRSGMRWSCTGGQHVLSLRAVVKSNRWDALWKEYTNQLLPCAA